nr:peptidoglycan DD-metalloendopeptidase family protein [Actinomycetota bacterium]
GNNNGGNGGNGNNNGGNGGNGGNNGGHNNGGDKDAKHDRRRDAKKGDGSGRGVGKEGARRKQSPSKRGGRNGGTSGDDRQDGGGSDGLTPGASGNAPKKGDAASSGTVPPSSIASSSYEFAGSYSSSALMSRALKLRSLGWSNGDVATKIFAPFIIGGEAGWIDTWGAPRSGGRSHEGQDVFCNYGAPVLASEDGVVEFDEGGLGGRVARLLRPDGSYWYYAHLAEWNTDQFSSGDGVEVGDIIGFCGNTGNALTTPPHVHFGFYGADGVAQNPMAKLVEWLHTAERRSLGYVSKVQVRRVQKVEAITSARRFGDAFTPAPTKRADQQELYAYLLDGAKGMPLSMLQTMLIEGVEIPAAGAEPLNPKLHYFEAWLNGQTFPALLQGVDQAP